MKALLLVFIGGGTGSCLRYALSKWFNQAGQLMPYGTLLANILSCMVLGFAAYLYASKYAESDWLKLLVLVGFCGGFSTFSTFSNEIFQFMKAGNQSSMVAYLLASLILCNFALALGGLLGAWAVSK